MKVRHKISGMIFEVEPNVTGEYYPELKPDRWQDVTAECVLSAKQTWVVHNGEHVIPDMNQSYRLRKVQWTEPYDHGVGAIAYRYAFIVERKVSE